ncbi:MAG: BREX system ATP-binding domain-containing protein [Deinococcota bacterium]
MSEAKQTGPTRIEHPEFGPGDVLRAIHQGFYWDVRFADGQLRRVPVNALAPDVLTALAQQAGLVDNQPYAAAPLDNEQVPTGYTSRTLIEALRLGIVPNNAAKTFMFGQDAARATVDSWLSRRGDGAAVLVGGYGTGKTHLLQYLREDALAQGYAVASATIDLTEVPFHQPKRVYAALASQFYYRLPGTPTRGLAAFLQEAARLGALRGHPYFALLTDYLEDTNYDLSTNTSKPGISEFGISEPGEHTAAERQTQAASTDELDDTLAWLMGKADAPAPAGAKTLPDTVTAANVYTYLLTSLAYIAKYTFGLQGLVLLIDEVEALNSGYYSKGQDLKTFNFLRALMHVSAGGSRLAAEWAGAPSEAALISSGRHQDIPFAYANPSHLRTMLALTPTPLLEELDELASARKIVLEPLDKAALMDMYASIYSHYLKAYPPSNEHWFEAAAKTQNVELIAKVVETYTETTRLVVKGAVEHLDVSRHLQGENY